MGEKGWSIKGNKKKGFNLREYGRLCCLKNKRERKGAGLGVAEAGGCNSTLTYKRLPPPSFAPWFDDFYFTSFWSFVRRKQELAEAVSSLLASVIRRGRAFRNVSA